MQPGHRAHIHHRGAGRTPAPERQPGTWPPPAPMPRQQDNTYNTVETMHSPTSSPMPTSALATNAPAPSGKATVSLEMLLHHWRCTGGTRNAAFSLHPARTTPSVEPEGTTVTTGGPDSAIGHGGANGHQAVSMSGLLVERMCRSLVWVAVGGSCCVAGLRCWTNGTHSCLSGFRAFVSVRMCRALLPPPLSA